MTEGGASLAGEPGVGGPLGDPRLPRPIKPPAYHSSSLLSYATAGTRESGIVGDAAYCLEQPRASRSGAGLYQRFVCTAISHRPTDTDYTAYPAQAGPGRVRCTLLFFQFTLLIYFTHTVGRVTASQLGGSSGRPKTFYYGSRGARRSAAHPATKLPLYLLGATCHGARGGHGRMIEAERARPAMNSIRRGVQDLAPAPRSPQQPQEARPRSFVIAETSIANACILSEPRLTAVFPFSSSSAVSCAFERTEKLTHGVVTYRTPRAQRRDYTPRARSVQAYADTSRRRADRTCGLDRHPSFGHVAVGAIAGQHGVTACFAACRRRA